MQVIFELITQYMNEIILTLLVLNLIFLISITVHGVKVRKIQKKYQAFMKKEDLDLEELLTRYSSQLTSLENGSEHHSRLIDGLNARVDTSLRKVAVLRYKAIENVGADLSFVIALLNQSNSGVVINGIYSY